MIAEDARMLVGHRVLVATKPTRYAVSQVVYEWKVIEVSPSGAWTRIMDEHGAKVWRATAEFSAVEILADAVPRGK